MKTPSPQEAAKLVNDAVPGWHQNYCRECGTASSTTTHYGGKTELKKCAYCVPVDLCLRCLRCWQEQAEIPRPRKIHFGWLWNKNGGVSPMCAKKPRRISMGHKSKETWTITPRFVTCPKCLTMLENTGRLAASDRKP